RFESSLCTQEFRAIMAGSNDQAGEPDVVMACCGEVPALETLAAVELLWKFFPRLKVRVINVVDLMKLHQDCPATIRARRDGHRSSSAAKLNKGSWARRYSRC